MDNRKLSRKEFDEIGKQYGLSDSIDTKEDLQDLHRIYEEEKKPRPKDSWVFWGSALGLIEEAVEFAAGRIEGALLLFRAVVDQWAAVGPNHIMSKFLGRDLS
jgi:hypothetical protein